MAIYVQIRTRISLVRAQVLIHQTQDSLLLFVEHLYKEVISRGHIRCPCTSSTVIVFEYGEALLHASVIIRWCLIFTHSP